MRSRPWTATSPPTTRPGDDVTCHPEDLGIGERSFKTVEEAGTYGNAVLTVYVRDGNLFMYVTLSGDGDVSAMGTDSDDTIDALGEVAEEFLDDFEVG